MKIFLSQLLSWALTLTVYTFPLAFSLCGGSSCQKTELKPDTYYCWIGRDGKQISGSTNSQGVLVYDCNNAPGDDFAPCIGAS